MNLKFPKLEKAITAKWAPLYYEPIRGSGERLVVGIMVSTEDQSHLEFANAADRLECLYGQDANAIKYALDLIETHYRSELKKNPSNAFNKAGPISGVSIGDLRPGEGRSLEDLAVNWLSQISSIYKKDFIEAVHRQYEDLDLKFDEIEPTSHRDVGSLVFEYVTRQREGLEHYFAKGLRGTPKKKSHDVRIDYAGSKMVANFGILKSKFTGHSSNSIKRKLWDLAIERDQEKRMFSQRTHELLIQIPALNNSEISEEQHDNVNEALQALERQADIEELRLRALPNAKLIAQRVLEVEAID